MATYTASRVLEVINRTNREELITNHLGHQVYQTYELSAIETYSTGLHLYVDLFHDEHHDTQFAQVLRPTAKLKRQLTQEFQQRGTSYLNTRLSLEEMIGVLTTISRLDKLRLLVSN